MIRNRYRLDSGPIVSVEEHSYDTHLEPLSAPKELVVGDRVQTFT